MLNILKKYKYVLLLALALFNLNSASASVVYSSPYYNENTVNPVNTGNRSYLGGSVSFPSLDSAFPLIVDSNFNMIRVRTSIENATCSDVKIGIYNSLAPDYYSNFTGYGVHNFPYTCDFIFNSVINYRDIYLVTIGSLIAPTDFGFIYSPLNAGQYVIYNSNNIATGIKSGGASFILALNDFSTSSYGSSDFFKDLTTENQIYFTCSGVTDISCYLKNALIWSITPSENTLTRFTSISDILKMKAPFGYAFKVYESLSGINTSGTPAYTLQQVTPITVTIFTPLKTGITWFLYIGFIFALFIRFKNIII